MDKQAVNEDWQGIRPIIEKLRAKVLCQICSEVIQHSLQIDCGHRFCETCFTPYTKTRQIKCPVCKKHVKRSSYGKDIYGDALGKFISFLINNDDKSDDRDNIKNSNIPGVEHLDSSPKKNNQKNCKQLKNHRLDDEKPNGHPIIENNIPSVQPVNSSKKKEEEKSLEGSKKRKIDDNKPDDPPAAKEYNIPSVEPIKSSKKNEEKVFQDSKKQKLNNNNPNNPKTMSHNIPRVKPSRGNDKIKDFQDSKNRKLVQDWLQASQNKFNRLTQTQTSQHDEMNLLNWSQISLPSVSQRTLSTPASKKTRSTSLDSKDRLLNRRRSAVLKVIDDYDIEDGILKHELDQTRNYYLLNKFKESQYLNELGEQLQRTEDDGAHVILDRSEKVRNEKETSKNSKTSPTGGWERVQEIKKNVKCRKTPKQLNVTVNTSQSFSSKRKRKNLRVTESPVKETHVTDSKSKCQLNSSILQPASSCLSTLPLNITKNAEDLLYLAPTQKINTDQLDTEHPENFEDLNLTFEDKIIVFEDQLKHGNLKRMFHEIIDYIRNFSPNDDIQKVDASVQAEPTKTCNQQTQAVVHSRNIAIQCHVGTSNAEVQTNPEDLIIHEEELLANSLDNIIFDTEDLIGKMTKKPSQNLKSAFDNPSQNLRSFANKSAFDNPKPSTSAIKRPMNIHSSNSDEDEPKPVKKKNRFLKEDLSIEFANTAQVQNLETCATEGINYDEYIKEMLNQESESPVVQKAPVWEDCEDIIANVNHNVNKLAKITREETESNDVISGTEPSEPVKKRQMQEKTGTGDKKPKFIRSTQTCKKNRKMESRDVYFDDDFDDEFGKIEIPSLPKRINIISDIHVKPAEAENDLFSSDDDIINATPPLIMDSDEINTAHDFLSTTIPPPLNFQDAEEENETFINKEPQMKENPVQTTIYSLPSYQKLHSTPLSGVFSLQESVNLSPISSKNTENNIIPNRTRETPKRSGCLMTSMRNQQSMWNFINTSTQMSPSPSVRKVKPCITCSRLDHKQILPILNLTQKNLATYTASFTDDVTHLIVCQDINEMITIKFILAVASGIWVLKHDWILECLAQNRIVPEEPYESLDYRGGTGPKTARLKSKSDPLFKDFKFYFNFNDPSCTEEGTRKAVSKLGGTIFNKVVDLIKTDGKIPLIIVEDRMSQKDLCERWSELYDIAVVDLEWVSLCIARYRIVGILDYTSHSVDSLREWKYPDYLFRED